ncbi:MAG: hypothetical protein MI741_14665, partial [Rhodospirillales bacterium]|nr:hypothetical protein [Rhodospirillales bacterium]
MTFRIVSSAHLVNDPFGDPGLYVEIRWSRRSLLFDLGENVALSPTRLLRAEDIFVSHTHMDHFIGFDRLIRLFLGRDKTLFLFGPKGFIKNVEGKLAGYSWNLVANYKNSFSIHVSEVDGSRLKTNRYHCQESFIRDYQGVENDFNGTLYREPAFSVSAIILDHQIPCLGLKVAERFHVNINKEALDKMGLVIGPWLNRFKLELFNNQHPDSEFIIGPGSENNKARAFRLKELADRIAIITPGQKVAYIIDTRYSTETAARIVEFVKGVDQLYIETAFLDRHHHIAYEKYHLTAGQAGALAGRAQ